MKTECGCKVGGKLNTLGHTSYFVVACDRHSEQNVSQLEARVAELEDHKQWSIREIKLLSDKADTYFNGIASREATISRLTAELNQMSTAAMIANEEFEKLLAKKNDELDNVKALLREKVRIELEAMGGGNG